MRGLYLVSGVGEGSVPGVRGSVVKGSVPGVRGSVVKGSHRKVSK